MAGRGNERNQIEAKAIWSRQLYRQSTWKREQSEDDNCVRLANEGGRDTLWVRLAFHPCLSTDVLQSYFVFVVYYLVVRED